MDLREETQPHMDVKEIHEMLKNTLSPENYIQLLELMMKDVEKMIEWGNGNKSNNTEDEK